MAHLAKYIIDKYTSAAGSPKSATSHKAARRELQAVFCANLAALVKVL